MRAAPAIGLLLLAFLTLPAPVGAQPLSAAQERALKAGDAFRNCDACPEMVVVPAGVFAMGSPAHEESRDDTEGPQHRVTIGKPFALGKFEVTVDQFAAFIRDTGHDMGDRCDIWKDGSWEERPGYSWRDPGFPQTGAHAVACISWDDAKAYGVARAQDRRGLSPADRGRMGIRGALSAPVSLSGAPSYISPHAPGPRQHRAAPLRA